MTVWLPSVPAARRLAAGGIALLIRRLLVLLDVVVDQPTHQPGARAGNGAERRITADRAENGATTGADRGAGECTLLGVAHARTAGENQSADEQRQNGLHGAFSLLGYFLRVHGYCAA